MTMFYFLRFVLVGPSLTQLSTCVSPPVLLLASVSRTSHKELLDWIQILFSISWTATLAPETTIPSTTTAGPFVCPDDGNFAVPGQCTADFYICVNGVPYPAVKMQRIHRSSDNNWSFLFRFMMFEDLPRRYHFWSFSERLRSIRISFLPQ